MPKSLGHHGKHVNANLPTNEKKVRAIIAKSIETLQKHYSMVDADLGKAAGIDQKTIWRIRNQHSSCTADKLAAYC